MLRDGNRTAVMYALRRILVGEEIMWDYDIEQEPTPTHTPTKRLGNNIVTSDIDEQSLPYNDVSPDMTVPRDTDMRCLAVTMKDSFDEGFAILIARQAHTYARTKNTRRTYDHACQETYLE